MAEAKTVCPTPGEGKSGDGCKKKKSVIIAIIIAAIFVIGGGVAAFAYFSIKNSPENVAVDVFSNLLKEKNLQVEGDIKFFSKSFGGNENETLAVNLKTASNEDGNSTLSTNIIVGEDMMNINLEGVALNNGELFFRLTSDTNAAYFDDSEDDLLDGFTTSNLISTVNVPGSFDFDNISDKWIKISFSEIEKLIEQMFGQSAGTIANSIYTCSSDALKSIYEDNTEQVDLFKKHAFIVLKEKSDKKYDVMIKRQELIDYLNDFKETSKVKNLSNCFDSVLNSSSVSVSASDMLDKIAQGEEGVNTNFEMEIDNNHRIIKATLKIDGDNARIEMNLSFNYDEVITVSAPSESVSIIDLISELLNGFKIDSTLLQNCNGNILNCVMNPGIEDI